MDSDTIIRSKTTDYKSRRNKNEIDGILEENTLFSAAYQFYHLFPAHYFKVRHVLENIIGWTTLELWFEQNPRIFVLDVGCGTGTATAALIDTLISMRQEKQLKNTVTLYSIGIDPSKGAVGLFHKMMQELQHKCSKYGVELVYDTVPLGIPDAIVGAVQKLEEKRNLWHLPYFSRVFLFQVNVVRPLQSIFQARNDGDELLELFGLQRNEEDRPFGEIEAENYRLLFERVHIDHMHVVTVGTTDVGYLLPQRVIDMGTAISECFANDHRHHVSNDDYPDQYISYENPHSSYWRDVKRIEIAQPSRPFHVNISSIDNRDLLTDRQWEQVISDENLKLAWARVYKGVMGESLHDDIELRLFSLDVETNLARLRNQLISYAAPLLPTSDIQSYRLPKGHDKSRPRGLTRLEAEIMSVAVIQVLGGKVSALTPQSYAYRLTRTKNEYLYKPWFGAYKDYISSAVRAVKNDPEATVLRVDISSYYTQIVQSRLEEMISEELNVGDRIRWLLRLLLINELEDHEVDKGVVQGSIGSGFYANLYLRPVDQAFGANNPWDASLFRYVDDMIIVVPRSEHLQDVESCLDEQLRELGLEQNREKREVFQNAVEFLEQIENEEKSEYFEQLSEKSDSVLNPLLIMNTDYRDFFEKRLDGDERLWWVSISSYRDALTELGIYVTPSYLARKIHAYVSDPERRARDIGDNAEFLFPRRLPKAGSIEHYRKWAQDFGDLNSDWGNRKENLRRQLIEGFLEALDAIQTKTDSLPKLNQKVLRYSANKLASLGFTGIHRELKWILINQPWLIREPIQFLEYMARQGFGSEIQEILSSYLENDAMSAYMRACCLRAFRYIPSQVDFDWPMLVDYSCNSSVYERLMATETWLFLSPAQPPIKPAHIRMVGDAFENSDELPVRLIKNYLLLIHKYQPSLAEDYLSGLEHHDSLIMEVKSFMNSRKDMNLFALEEPPQLRQYYSSNRKLEAFESRGY